MAHKQKFHIHMFDDRQTGVDIEVGADKHVHFLKDGSATGAAPLGEGHSHVIRGRRTGGPISV